jgi:predicted O-methyltransferase YrrM
VTDYPNWFAQSAQYNFEEFLPEFKGKDALRFLQLGAYTGDASVWLLDNILTGQYCKLVDVDTWDGSDEIAHKDLNFGDVYCLYLDRVGGDTEWHRESTFDYLTRTVKKDIEQLEEWRFDFIYIDADHTTVGVLLDAELSWPLLKSGGIIAFDDYTWGHESGDPRLAPMVGIDLFLHRHQGEYELLAKNTQVWIRKK